MIAPLATAPTIAVTTAIATMGHVTATQDIKGMIALSTSAQMVAPTMAIAGVGSACAILVSQGLIVVCLCTRVCALSCVVTMDCASMVFASATLATAHGIAPQPLGNALMTAAGMECVSMVLVCASLVTGGRVAQSESFLRSAPTIAWVSVFARKGCVFVLLATRGRIAAYALVRMTAADTDSVTMAHAIASQDGAALCAVTWCALPIAL